MVESSPLFTGYTHTIGSSLIHCRKKVLRPRKGHACSNALMPHLLDIKHRNKEQDTVLPLRSSQLKNIGYNITEGCKIAFLEHTGDEWPGSPWMNRTFLAKGWGCRKRQADLLSLLKK